MAIIELGNHSRLNAAPGTENAPAVTYVGVPLGEGGSTMEPGLEAEELRQHRANALLDNVPTNLPDHEAILELLDLWPHHASGKPAWVASDDPDAEELVKVAAAYWGIPGERPEDFEDVYHTRFGAPGVGAWGAGVEALLTNGGRGIWGQALGVAVGTAQGVGTAATTTTFTTGAAPALNAWKGARIYVYSTSTGFAWTNVISNTTGGVATIDGWYTLAGVTATTPTTPWGYYIDGGTSFFSTVGAGQKGGQWMGITSTNITPAATDTTLSGEQTSNGFARALATFAVTSATSPVTYTLTNTYTYTTTGSLTLFAIGIFTGAIVTSSGTMIFETSLNASATVNASGDQVTVTETVTGS